MSTTVPIISGANAPVPPLPTDRVDEVVDDATPRRGRGLRRFLRHRPAMVGLAYLMLLLIMALFAPWLAPKDPNRQELLLRLQSPGHHAWLGTDLLGRDQFSRLIYGARVSLLIATGSMALALLLGVPTGLAAGYLGGKVDTVIGRMNDSLLALPGILYFFTIIAVFGHTVPTLCFAIGSYSSTNIFLIARATTRAVSGETYIEASRALGATTRRTLANHVLPNILSPLLVRVALVAAAAVVAEASLSVLGLGVAPPTATWGGMLQTGNSVIREAPFLVYAPGVMIAFTVLAFTFVGDGLRRAVATTRSAVSEKS
jgi:peptide/nickel transport system permease protein